MKIMNGFIYLKHFYKYLKLFRELLEKIKLIYQLIELEFIKL